MPSIRATSSHSSLSDSSLAFDSLPLHLPPEQLKARLVSLIQAAVKHGAATVAETVARHFQALSLHPELTFDLDERAAYCRGARHWLGLAAVSDRPESHQIERLPSGAH
jgi:hypothetical protein